jgi:hypothetical protein
MRRIYSYLSSFCLAFTIIIAVAGIGCAGRVRIYDSYHDDYHVWNHDEDVHYRQYLADRHEEYRDYAKLSPDEQKGYWDWRHSH